MHYPWWYVPGLTAPMLIAVIAVLHVLVSHYTVGGGLFLAVETGYAYCTKDRALLAYLNRTPGSSSCSPSCTGRSRSWRSQRMPAPGSRVQNMELAPYLDVAAEPVRVRWSPLIVSLALFVAGLAGVVWMPRRIVAVHRAEQKVVRS